MKIRIQGDRVRLRLSQTEVDLVGNGEVVSEKTHFGATSLTYALQMSDKISSLTATFNNTQIQVLVPAAKAREWAGSDLVGLESKEHSIPHILIEKDFQCLTDRSSEDESDLFPNPNLTC